MTDFLHLASQRMKRENEQKKSHGKFGVRPGSGII